MSETVIHLDGALPLAVLDERGCGLALHLHAQVLGFGLQPVLLDATDGSDPRRILMPRPNSPDPRDVMVSFRVTRGEKERIDKIRGGQSLGDFIRGLNAAAYHRGVERAKAERARAGE